MHSAKLSWLLVPFLALAPGVALGWQGLYGGSGAFINPANLPRQAKAVITPAGHFSVKHVSAMPGIATELREEKRVRTVEDGGEVKTVEEVVQVPVTVARMVAFTEEFNIPVEQAAIYNMEGKPVPAEKVAERLKKATTVLFASRQVPSYYLSIFKPDTLLFVVSGEFYVDDIPRGLPGAEDDAPAVPEAEPAAEPAPPAPEAPAVAEKLPPLPPNVALAKWAKNLVTVRSFAKETNTEKMLASEPTEDGKVHKVEFEVETESIVDIEQRFPPKSIRTQRADGKHGSSADLPKLLAASRCILVSADGEQVDASFLEIVKPDTLILLTPQPTAPKVDYGFGVPVPIPAPAVPAPAPVPDE